MKIKAVSNLVKEHKGLNLLDGHQRQHISVGKAVYPLDGFPPLTEETVFAVLDIPVGDRPDYDVLRATVSPVMEEVIVDNLDGDEPAQLVDMVVSVSGETLRPIYTTHGMVCVRESERKPIADSGKTAEYYSRVVNENIVIVVKNGFQRIATISPLHSWATDSAKEWLYDMSRSAGRLNNQLHNDDPEDSRYSGKGEDE